MHEVQNPVDSQDYDKIQSHQNVIWANLYKAIFDTQIHVSDASKVLPATCSET